MPTSREFFELAVPAVAPEDKIVDITMVGRLKHADLYAAGKKLAEIENRDRPRGRRSAGPQVALARHLGLGAAEVGEWINFRSYPSFRSTNGRRDWSDIERKLFALTGKTLDELFPAATEEIYGADNQIEITRSATVGQLARLVDSRGGRDIAESMEREDTRRLIGEAVKVLPPREREILRLRYELDGPEGDAPPPYTEIARRFGLTVERIRQIESRAIDKLRRFRGVQLRPALDGYQPVAAEDVNRDMPRNRRPS
jgi:RNA polymerase sigma factor (sigma-70 family)